MNQQIIEARKQVENRVECLLEIKKGLRSVNKFNDMNKDELPAKAYIFIIYDDHNMPPTAVNIQEIEDELTLMKNMLKEDNNG
jgi:hypothetical protein